MHKEDKINWDHQQAFILNVRKGKGDRLGRRRKAILRAKTHRQRGKEREGKEIPRGKGPGPE